MDRCTSVLLWLALLASSVYGDVIRTQKCYLPAGKTPTCTVHEVRVNPCPQAENDRPCKLKLGSNATLEFDFTTTFTATKAGSLAYKAGTLADIPFEQMDQDGCKYTTCPIEPGKKHVYKYDLSIGTQFPATTHQVKWKLWNDADYHEQCCFKLSLELTN